MSDLRQNYSLIQEQLRRVQNEVKNGSLTKDVEKGKKDEMLEDVDVGNESIRRLKHVIRLLKEGINVYENFTRYLDKTAKETIEGVQCSLCCCSGGDIQGGIEMVNSTFLMNATELQKKIGSMMSVVESILKK